MTIGLSTRVNISLFYIIIRFIFNFIGTSSPLLEKYLCVSRLFIQAIFNQRAFRFSILENIQSVRLLICAQSNLCPFSTY